MIRHPFYIAICLFSAGYLAFSNAKGLSFLQSVTRSFTSSHSPGSRSGGFNHK
jgi:hypothetical protein